MLRTDTKHSKVNIRTEFCSINGSLLDFEQIQALHNNYMDSQELETILSVIEENI